MNETSFTHCLILNGPLRKSTFVVYIMSKLGSLFIRKVSRYLYQVVYLSNACKSFCTVPRA